jgi:hypothetical protein
MASAETSTPGKRFWRRERILGLALAILLTCALPISIDQGYFRYNAYVLPCLGLSAAILYLIFISTIPAVKDYVRQVFALNRIAAALLGSLALVIVVVGLAVGFRFAFHRSEEHVQEARRANSAMSSAPAVSTKPAAQLEPPVSTPEQQSDALREEEVAMLQQIVEARRMNDWNTVSTLVESEITRTPDLLILYFEASVADWHLCKNNSAIARNEYFLAHAPSDPKYKNKPPIEIARKNRDVLFSGLSAPGCPGRSKAKEEALKAKAAAIRESYMAQHPGAKAEQVVSDVNHELQKEHIPISIDVLPPSVPCSKHGIVLNGVDSHISNVHSSACFTEDVINVTGKNNDINGVEINTPGQR